MKLILTNHKGSILHHITSLVINNLGGGHIHACTDVQTETINFKKPGVPACGAAPGLKMSESSTTSLKWHV